MIGTVLTDSVAIAAIAIIVLLPALIIGFSELNERLRQRGSAFQRTVATVRTWVLPLLALWALVVFVFEADRENVAVRWLTTALLVAVVAAGIHLARAFIEVARERSRARGGRRLPELLFLLPRLAILIAGFWILFNEVWDVDLTGLAAALGVGSLVIALALQDTLSGLASGLLLVGDRPFNPGDWIKVGDLEGRVVDINWRSSRIEDRNGDLVVVPNSSLAGATLINFDEPSRFHRVVVPVQVAFSNAPTRAKEMLLAAAYGTPGVLADPAPAIRVVQIDDPLMGYEVDLWIDDFARAPRVFSDFGSLVWYQSHRLGVPLPSPAYDLYHHDPIKEAADAELTPTDLADRLRRAPVLEELDEGELSRLAGASRPVLFSQGETILDAGRINRDLYVIWEGLARITVPGAEGVEVSIVDLGAGDVFGLLSRSARLASPPRVLAVTDCALIVIDADAAGAVTSRNPDLSEALNQLMVARHRRLERVQSGALMSAGQIDTGAGSQEPQPAEDQDGGPS